jgi:tRNA pseudouridine55 synthase
VGPFTVEDARTLDELAEDFDVKDLTAVARRCFPTFALDEDQTRDVRFGRRLTADLGAQGPVAVLADTGEFLALYEQRGEVAVAVAVFTG